MSDPYENLCPFCESNLLLTYFCADCASVFCEECVHFALCDELICASCGSKEISLVNMAALECKVCKSKHIATVQKQVKTCPNCSSSKVTKIVDKFDALRNRFKNIITGAKRFLSPLAYAVDTISLQKEKLIRLREDSVKMCHYPRLEMELLQLIKLFKDGKHIIQAKTSDFFQHINRNFKTYFEIEKSPPRLIPLLEAELESMEKSAESIISYGNSTNEKLEDKFTDVRTKIEFMNSLQRMFMRYISLLGNAMDYNENPVFGIRGKFQETNHPETDHSGRVGTILVTNRKIYFLQEKGLFNKKMKLILSLRLDELSRVRVKGLMLKKIILEFGSLKYIFQLPKKNMNQLINYIEKARVFDNNKIDRDILYSLKHVDVSIKQFRNALESAIISLIGYKTEILEHSDPINFDQFSQYDEFLDPQFPSNPNFPYQNPQHPPSFHESPDLRFQNNQARNQNSSFNSTDTQYKRLIEQQQADKLHLLHSIYQKRPPVKQDNGICHDPLPLSPPPVPQIHQQGTISHPYQPGLRNFPSDSPNKNEISSYQYQKSQFPIKTQTSNILEKVRQVIPDESPYIPQPLEVQQSQQIPEIDVSTLVTHNNTNPEKLLRLEEQLAWLQRKIYMLEKRRDQGKISEEAFLRLYEDSYRELYRCENHIKQIKKQQSSI